MKGVINRLVEEKVQTLGRFYLYEGTRQLFDCVILELPYRSNKKNISNICSGVYTCKLRYSEKYDWHYELQDVQGRSLILIHFGNYYTDTRGCILFGKNFDDINKDGYKDITSSRATIKEFMSIAPKEFELTINEI